MTISTILDRRQEKTVEAEQSKPQPARSNFILDEGVPYFQVDFGDGQYRFAHLVGNEVQFRDLVGDYVPQPLPLVDGKPLRLVIMPDSEVANASLHSPVELFERLKRHLTHYLDLALLDFELCIYYIIFTWFSPKVDTLGYLRLLGDTGKGKSRALKVIGDLTFYPIIASGASTFSGIARTKQKFKGTLIIDEADIAGDASHQLIKYFNLGFERGKIFILSDKKNPRQQDYFDPFCSKVIAMRQPFRDNATEGRLLSISMHETGSKTIPIILPHNYEVETQKLRNEITRFVLQHWHEVDGDKMIDLSYLNIEPRLKQLAMPLSIIFQLWPEGKERFIEYLSKRQQEVRQIRATSWDGTLVNTVIQIAQGELDLPLEFQQYKGENGMPTAVTPGMVAKTTGSTAKTATERLSGCGFELEIKRVKVADTKKTKTVRAYSAPNGKAWQEILSRYYLNNDDEIPDVPSNLRGRFFMDVTEITDVTVLDPKNTPPINKDDGVLFRAKSVTSETSVTVEAVLGMPIEKAIDIYGSDGAIGFRLSNGDYCDTVARLRELLSNPNIKSEDLEAIRTHLEKVVVEGVVNESTMP